MTPRLKYKEDDIVLLLPSFRPRVEQVLKTMRALGFTPVLFDTVRTEEQAAKNSAKGTGVRLSMHIYGCAADIICNQHGWACAKHKCKFYVKLGQASQAAGLYWGGSFGDMPHMQALPFAPKVQNEMRALGYSDESAGARDALSARHLRPVSGS